MYMLKIDKNRGVKLVNKRKKNNVLTGIPVCSKV